MKSPSTKRVLSNTVFLLIISSSFLFYAYNDGITGKTKKNGTGCSTGTECHSSVPSSNVIVTINGPDALTINETGTYTVTITGGPLVRGGTNIAASAGDLAPGEGLRKSENELTHIAPKTPAGGAVTFQFTYTAPAAEGSQTLFANGNSVNFNDESSGDEWNFAQNKIVNVTNTTDVDDDNQILTYNLNQNYPNPFNPSTQISYSIAEAGYVKLIIYNMLGDEVKTLVDGFKNSGNHTIQFNADNLPAGRQGLSSGIYFYKLITSDFVSAKKMILAK